MRIFKAGLLGAIAMLGAIAALGQTTTIYTGTIKDLAQNVVTSGQVTFTLAPPTDSTIPGIGRFTPFTVPCNINVDGTLSGYVAGEVSGVCIVTKNTALTPGGTSYRICVQPQFATPGSCFFDYATGDTKDISTVAPTLSTGPINYGGTPGPRGLIGPTGATGPAGNVYPGLTPDGANGVAAAGNVGAATMTLPNGDVQTQISAKLPLAGGTMSGPLQGKRVSTAGNTLYSNNADGSMPILHVAGTSIPSGWMLANQTLAYPNLVAAALGWGIDNRSIPGSTCPDVMGSNVQGAVPEYDFTKPTTTDSVWLIAPGDNSTTEPGPVKAEQYRGCMTAAIAFAGLPDQQWIRPNQAPTGTCTTTGAVANANLIPGAPAIALTGENATLTCQLPAGRTVYVVVQKQFGGGGTTPNVPYRVSVDGTDVIEPTSATTTFNTYTSTAVAHQATWWMYAIRVGGLLQTPHTVVITIGAGADQDNGLMVYAEASVSPSSFTAGGPRVIYPSPLQYSAAGYAVNSTSPFAKATYAALEDEVVQQMASDGFHVLSVDMLNDVAYNPKLNADPDGIHPNAAGHVTLAAAVLNAMVSAATPARLSRNARLDIPNVYTQGQKISVDTRISSGDTFLPVTTFINSTDQHNFMVMGAHPPASSWPAYSLVLEGGSAGHQSGLVLNAMGLANKILLQTNRFTIATVGPYGFTTTGIKISNGVSNDGGGKKHIRLAGCVTAATIGAYCDTIVTWTTPFADINYTPICQVTGTATSVVSVYSITAEGFSARLTNVVAAASTGAVIACVAEHDLSSNL